MLSLEEEKHVLELCKQNSSRGFESSKGIHPPFWKFTRKTDAWQEWLLQCNRLYGYGNYERPTSIIGDRDITTTARMVELFQYAYQTLRSPEQREGETAPAAEDGREDGEVLRPAEAEDARELLPAEAVPSIFIQDENPRDTTETPTYDNTKDGVDDTKDDVDDTKVEAEKHLRIPTLDR
ncbi:MAG: hypothetical protein Q9186_006148 [Xanthomendoza sp. 1 TL-2023]